MSNKFGIYIHIPFCKKRCFYCDFNTNTNKNYLMKSYTESLVNEIQLYTELIKKKKAISLYFGGGTPSNLQDAQIKYLIKIIYSKISFMGKPEITFEVNPDGVDFNKLKLLYDLGVNRISIGLQTVQNTLLKSIGRTHTWEGFCETYYKLRDIGFKNLSIDVIYGLPEQTLNHWKETLKRIVKLRPEHISTYGLKLEKRTKLYKDYTNNKLRFPNENKERTMYHFASDYLRNNGYNHYEISNFALDKNESKHNIIYWTGKEYLGIGAGSHSYISSNFFSNYKSIIYYIKMVNKNRFPIKKKEYICNRERMVYFIILNLRLLKNGINKKEFKQEFNQNFDNMFSKELEELKYFNLLQENNDRIMLTKKGVDISNEVFVRFLPYF